MLLPIAISLLLSSAPAPVDDDCSALLPAPVGVLAASRFPDYRLPLVTDNLEEDVAWKQANAGHACLGVAQADFDGNGATDWLIGLTARTNTGGLVVVALSIDGAWQWHELAAWPHARSRLYVSVAEPGIYENVLDVSSAGTGEVPRMDCPNPVAVFGATESSAVAYCRREGAWTHAWISD